MARGVQLNIYNLPSNCFSLKQVEFEAIRGTKDTSDIAIDDVIVGHCYIVSSYQSVVNAETKETGQQFGIFSPVYGNNDLKKF